MKIIIKQEGQANFDVDSVEVRKALRKCAKDGDKLGLALWLESFTGAVEVTSHVVIFENAGKLVWSGKL